MGDIEKRETKVGPGRRLKAFNYMSLFFLALSFVPSVLLAVRWRAAEKAEAGELKSLLGITLLVALICAVNWIVLYALRDNPRSYNYPVKVTDRNRERLYALGRETVAAVAVGVALMSAAINFCLMPELGDSGALPWAAGLPTALLLAVGAYYVVKMFKLKDSAEEKNDVKRRD